MRRILLAAAVLAASLAAAAPAQARHGHCGWGWGGRYCGYGGCGGGYCGYRGWGGYGWGGIGLSINYCRPYYNYGWNFGVPAYCYRPSYIYGGYNIPRYYDPTPIGYYGYYGSTYNPNANFSGLVQLPGLAAGQTAPAQVLNLLRLTDDDLVSDLRARTAELPRIGPLQETTIATRPALNQSNIAQRRKADQQLATGDMLFREQKFHAALQRYKDAARLAPAMAEPHWRQGHALIATGNFELAGGAFRRALALDPDTGRDGFSLNALYGPATIAKTSHIEDLAAWALDHAGSSDAYFLVGVTLHYDGQAERATKFFARAAHMAGAGGDHIAAFVPATSPERGPVAAGPAAIADRQPPPPLPPVSDPPPAPAADAAPAPAVPAAVVSKLVEI
jgi:tetratricopeptide (TPR) repeat protein